MTETKEFTWLTNDLIFKHIFSKKEIIKDFFNSYLNYIKSNQLSCVAKNAEKPKVKQKEKRKEY